MNRLTNISKAQKTTLIVLSVLIVAVAVYGAAAFTTRSWPFSGSTELQTKEPAKNPAMTISKPVVDVEKKILKIDNNVATTQQGTCKLTMSNKENTYILTNSTEGVEGESGCLDWNIGTGSIPAGTYDVEIKFIGKSQTATTKQAVTLP